MNAPFKPPLVAQIHGQPTVSISMLKANPAAVIESIVPSKPIAILNRNREVAYLVSPEFVDMAFEAMEEILDIELIAERRREKDQGIRVSLDDL
jgi:antitoxin StbD